jgi:hypothetical protein
MGLPAAQLEAARRTLRRATNSEDIDVTRTGSGDLIVKRTRPGKVGYQVLEDTIRQDGGKDVVQRAYDDAGNLVHHDAKGGRP